jgi:hypothetical protein
MGWELTRIDVGTNYLGMMVMHRLQHCTVLAGMDCLRGDRGWVSSARHYLEPHAEQMPGTYMED